MQVAERKCKVAEGKKKWNEGNPRERVRRLRVVSANRARGQMANGAKASEANTREREGRGPEGIVTAVVARVGPHCIGLV